MSEGIWEDVAEMNAMFREIKPKPGERWRVEKRTRGLEVIREMCCPDCFGVGYTRPHLDDEPCSRCWTLGVVEYIQSGIEHE